MNMFEPLEAGAGSFSKSWMVVPGQRYVLRWHCTGTPAAGTIALEEVNPLDEAAPLAVMSGTDTGASACSWALASMTVWSGGAEFVAAAPKVRLAADGIAGGGDFYAALVEVRP